jgi:hypothetical protein
MPYRKVVAVSCYKIVIVKMDIRIVMRLNELIHTKQTGTPVQLAKKVEISERSLNYYIAFMRNELKAPIVYDRKKETYWYETECTICFTNKSML